MTIRKIKTYYHEPFNTWLRQQTWRNRTRWLQEKFGVSISLLYKYASGLIRPSMKHIALYEEFLREQEANKNEQTTH